MSSRVKKHSQRAGMPHAVYRCWDADGVLLYVGCSMQPEVRWRAWRRSRDVEWPSQVARRELSWYGDRSTALVAESCAVLHENPRYNRRNPTTMGMSAFLTRGLPLQNR